MSMKNDLINSINTKVSAPDMDYSSLITSGANTLDEAFKPYKNTEQIISANNHLNALATLKNFELGKLAVQEQDEKFRQQTKEYFSNSKKVNDELGANLFTNNGFNLNGTEESWKADKIKYFEQYTGMENVSIYDIINNLDDPKLNLPVAYKEEMRKYAEYNYNKNKIDNMILDDGDINKLANENYDKDALFGQNFETFKLGYKQNSNRLDDVISGKANQLIFNSIHNHRFFEAERLEAERLEDRERLKKQAEGQQNSNNNQNVNKNTSNNPEDNFQNIDNNGNKAQQIQNKIDMNNLSKKDLDDNKSLEKIVGSFEEDPYNQLVFLDQVLGLNGVDLDKIYNDLEYKEQSLSSTSGLSGLKSISDFKNTSDMSSKAKPNFKVFEKKAVRKQALKSLKYIMRGTIPTAIAFGVADYFIDPLYNDDNPIYRKRIESNFIGDLFINARDERLLQIDLSDYDYEALSEKSKKIYNITKKLQEIKSLEYIKVVDNTIPIIENSKFSFSENLQYNAENEKYLKLGNMALAKENKFEKDIKNNKNIYKENQSNTWFVGKATREYHNNNQDTELRPSSFIVANQYDGSNENLRTAVYHLITSDEVLDIRFELMRLYQNSPKAYANMLKDPEQREMHIKDLEVAMVNAYNNIKLPKGSISPNYKDIALVTLITDCMTLPNKDKLKANPIALGAIADEINKTVSKHSLASFFNANNTNNK